MRSSNATMWVTMRNTDANPRNEPRHVVLQDCEFLPKPPQSFDDFFYETRDESRPLLATEYGWGEGGDPNLGALRNLVFLLPTALWSI